MENECRSIKSSYRTVTSMLFYGAISTAFIASVVAIPHWVPVSPSQFGFIACLGVGANFLLYCLLKAFKYAPRLLFCYSFAISCHLNLIERRFKNL